MTTWLKQSTATDVELGPFVDSVDGVTAETGLTISQADCQLIKNGGAAAQKNDSTSATHLAGGHYKVPLNTTDTNTLGRLRLYVNESGALPAWRDFMVLPANIYDSLVGGSDYLDVNTVQAAGTAWGSGAITAASIAADAITAAKVASDAVTEIQNGLATAAALTTIDDFLDTEIAAILADTNELQTDWVNGGRLDLLIDAIKAKTDNLPSDPADDSDIDTQLAAIAAYLDTEVAAILAAVDTEVAAIKTKTDYLPSAAAGAAGGVFIAGSNAATTVAITGNITGNLSGSVGSVTGAVGSVTGNVGGNVAGSVGSVTGAVGSVTGNVGGNVTGSVGSLAAQAKTDVNAEVVDALATDTYAEPGSVPAATSSLEDKIGWLFMLARNARTTTATTDAVRNDANSANVATSTLNDDGTTFTRGEYS